MLRKLSRQPLCGFLPVIKPAGVSSRDVVNMAVTALKEKKIGHTGTLDPFATGVLVLAVGPMTRFIPFLETSKEYLATFRFGQATDTDDPTGEPLGPQVNASSLTAEAIQDHLKQFIGTIQQHPPVFSAIHHRGRRLHERARSGESIDVESLPLRTVEVNDIVLSNFRSGTAAEVDVRVSCGGGVYIRSIGRDLGTSLGVPAHTTTLHRSLSNNIRDSSCVPVSLQDLEDVKTKELALSIRERLLNGMLPPDAPFQTLPALHLLQFKKRQPSVEDVISRFKNGNSCAARYIEVAELGTGECSDSLHRVYVRNGNSQDSFVFLGLAKVTGHSENTHYVKRSIGLENFVVDALRLQ